MSAPHRRRRAAAWPPARRAPSCASAGYDGPIVLIGEEPHAAVRAAAAVQGPTCSATARATTPLVHESWYAEHDVDLRDRHGRTAIDLAAPRRSTADGGPAATTTSCCSPPGARPRRLRDGRRQRCAVVYLRTLDDSRRLKARLTAGARVGIVGGGWIGLEVAAAARSRGAEVTVLETARPAAAARPRAGGRQRSSPTCTASTASTCGTGVAGHRHRGRSGGGASSRLATATAIDADLRRGRRRRRRRTPSSPRPPGCAVDNGIARRRAACAPPTPHVYAAGDVANADHPVLGDTLRVEHWDTAIQQGAVAAPNDARRRHALRHALPYFFTDQYDLGMEYVGNPGPDGYDRVVLRGDPATASSRPGGCAATGSSPACTSTTGTRSTRSGRSSAQVIGGRPAG